MIFPVAECERTVQVGDKTRLLGVKSYVGKGEERISKVEICPEYAQEAAPTPFTLSASGTRQGDNAISTIAEDLSQVQVGMTVTSDLFTGPATVQSVDTDTLYIDGATIDPSAYLVFFTITGSVNEVPTSTFIDVSGQDERDWYLDWAYAGATRDVTFAVRVSAGQLNQTALKTVRVLSQSDDLIFSTDDDLRALEPDLSRYVPEGRSSFINVHREARNKILESLSDEGIRNQDGTPLTSAVLKDVSEVRTWSRDLALSLIFQGSINEAGDVFSQKAQYYNGQAQNRQDRAYLSLTVPVNGSTDPYRSSQVQTVSLSR